MTPKSHPTAPDSCRVYTPPILAKALVHALGDTPATMWLEPCFGQGVFLNALNSFGVTKKRIYAIELDSLSTTTNQIAVTQHETDFLSWSSKTRLRFDRVIGNPPYLSIGKLPSTLQAAALGIKTPSGHPLSLRTNCWHAFLCASISLLNKGGAIGFVLPASWDYADYAKELKEQMCGLFSCLETHRSKKPLFDSVADGSVVVVASGYGLGSAQWTRYEYADRTELVSALTSSIQGTSRATSSPTTTHFKRMRPQRRLGDVLKIRIGAVTGDNSYFLLTDEERKDRKLPKTSLLPVVTKSRHLTKSEIGESDWQDLRDEGERVWLFRPREADFLNPDVRSYMALQPNEGGCRRTRYKIRSRTPWYHTKLHAECDAFLSGMASTGPWLCMRTMPKLYATNTLYTAHFVDSLTEEEKFAWALTLLTPQVREAIQHAGRMYPDGLLKFEPSDIVELLVDAPTQTRNARETYAKAVSRLLKGDTEGAETLVTRWLAA